MRNSIPFGALLGTLVLFGAGCVNTEQKFGRGMNNVVEFVRGGEIRRSMEQTAIFSSPDVGYTTGFIHGFNRSLIRTAVGAYEVLSAPFPPYDPIVFPVNPVYPATYTPRLLSEPFFHPDVDIGFSGGDIAPMIPGSRFHIFEN